MKYKLILPAFLALTLLACGSAGKQNPESSNDAQEDATARRSPFTDSLVSRFRTVTLPFEIDSAWYSGFEPTDTLSDRDLRFLLEHAASTVDSAEVSDVFTINALKKAGTYNAYVDSLDLSELKDATAHPLAQYTVDKDRVLIWSIVRSSFEACPYYAGTAIYLTVIPENGNSYCKRIGDAFSAGDAPNYYFRISEFTFQKDGRIDVLLTEENGDDEQVEKRNQTRSATSWKL